MRRPARSTPLDIIISQLSRNPRLTATRPGLD